MKKFIVVLLIAIVGITSCKKEKKSTLRADKPIAVAIIGPWYTTSETYEYFNASNEKVFNRTVEPNWEYSIHELFKITNPQGQRLLRTEYTVTKVNGKNYFTYVNNGVTETFEITFVQQDTMTWRQEKTNSKYVDNGEKIAAKEVIIINFLCPCK